MGVTLDLAISTVIGGILLLILLNLNGRVSDEAQRSFIETYPQVEANAMKEILDFDIPKIGYGLIWPQRAIQIAEAERLRFAFDSSRAGAFDSIVIEYQALPPFFSEGGEREVMQIRRRYVRGSSVEEQSIGANVTEFRFQYFDVNGAALTAPIPAAQLMRIKMIRVIYTTESPWKTERRVASGGLYTELYPYQQVSKIYRPRNLR